MTSTGFGHTSGLEVVAGLLAQPVPLSDPTFIGVAAAGGLLLVVVVFLIIRSRRRRHLDEGQATCGRCGYIVTGLPTFSCPECGSDLREVGIVRKGQPASAPSHLSRPNLRDTGRLMLILGIWTIIYALLYASIGTGSYPQQPWDSANRPAIYGFVDGYFWPYQGKSTHSVALEPQSEAYRRITVTEQREAKFQGWRNAPGIRWTGDSPNVGLTKFAIALQLDTLTGRTSTMEVDPTNGTAWRYEDPDKPGSYVAGSKLDGSIIWGWMMRNGVDQPSMQPKEESDSIADLINRSIQQGAVGSAAAPWAVGRLERLVAQQRSQYNETIATFPFKSYRGTAADTYGPAWSIYWLSIPFGLGVYSYGSNWIWMRNRRRRTGKKHPHDDPSSPGHGPGDRTPSHGNSNWRDSRDLQRPRSRTLTILFTDLKDFTQRAATAPRESFRALLIKNREIVEGVVSATEGLIVKTMGDAYLITYESATDAVLAALSIQRAATRFNEAKHPSGPLEYRIAVCTGEVTIENGDVFGTPVNVAARVQALAEPGAVYFTESTLHAINAAEVRCIDIGTRELKGIATPVRLFEARPVETTAA